MFQTYRNIAVKLGKILVLFAVVFGVEKLIKHWEWARIAYMNTVYYPLQKLRVLLFGDVAFSVGDAVYLILLLTSIIAVLRVIKCAVKSIRMRSYNILGWELVRLLRWGVVIYTVFIFSWGMNYTRQPLLYKWYKNQIIYDAALGRRRIDYNWNDEELIQVLDTLQESILTKIELVENKALFDKELVNAQAYDCFRRILGSRNIVNPLKESSLGKYLQTLGIQGYFVPFSGEVHYSGDLFYLFRPFVFMHEMAHQKGIASETDANLVAYVLCAASQNEVFKLSARFDLFLYVLGDLRRVNAGAYKHYVAHQIAPGIRRIMDDMEEHRKQYESFVRGYSMGFYDGYLKFFGQHEGLKSYSMMTFKVMLYYRNGLNVEDVLEY